jgi:hypothetical protein
MFCVEMSPGRPQTPNSKGFRHCLKFKKKKKIIPNIPTTGRRLFRGLQPKMFLKIYHCGISNLDYRNSEILRNSEFARRIPLFIGRQRSDLEIGSSEELKYTSTVENCTSVVVYLSSSLLPISKSDPVGA